MNALIVLIPVSLSLALTFLALFIKAARAGQFEDMDDPAERILHED